MEVHASGCQECQVAAMWLCINFAALRRAHASWLENSPGLLSSILLMEGCTHSPMPKVRQFRVPHRRCLRWPAFVGWLSRAAYFFNRMHLGIYWDRFWGNSQFLKVSRYSNFSMHCIYYIKKQFIEVYLLDILRHTNDFCCVILTWSRSSRLGTVTI